MPCLHQLRLPLWCACGRRQTCPGEASAAPPCAQSLGCAPPGVELPCRSPRGHIPPSGPAAPLLLGACQHWCMCSAGNNREGKSTCSHGPSFAPSPSPPGAAQSWSTGRGRWADSSLIWHRGAERRAHPPPLSKLAACLAAQHQRALARCLLRPWDFSEVGRPWKEARRQARILIPHPLPSHRKDPSLPPHLRQLTARVGNTSSTKISGFLCENARETITGRLAQLFPQVPCNYWCLSFGTVLSLWRGRGQQLRELTEGSRHRLRRCRPFPVPREGLLLAGRLGRSLILFIISCCMHTTFTHTHSLPHILLHVCTHHGILQIILKGNQLVIIICQDASHCLYNSYYTYATDMTFPEQVSLKKDLLVYLDLELVTQVYSIFLNIPLVAQCPIEWWTSSCWWRCESGSRNSQGHTQSEWRIEKD